MSQIDIYRELQDHLNQLPIAFPPTKDGVEIRLLKHLFTPEEAKIAAHLNFAWKDLESIESIYERIKPLGYTIEELKQHLDNMAKKGAIMRIKQGDNHTYGNAMLVIGMFEFQVNKLTKEFIQDFRKYFATWAMDNAKIPIPQMRTIPIGLELDHEIGISTYDDIKQIMDQVEGPFAIINCVCRQEQDLLNEPCKKTSRREVCMGFGIPAQNYIDAGWGREISKEEAVEFLKKNEKEGLVFQPNNSQKIDFICSCCPCCCESLANLKKMPNPADLVSTNHFAEVNLDICTGCGECVEQCPMDAISLVEEKSSINRRRCIGCGNCVAVCASNALKLQKKDRLSVPPPTMVELYNSILKVKNKMKERELKKQQRIEKKR